jgi:hypothetical protein
MEQFLINSLSPPPFRLSGTALPVAVLVLLKGEFLARDARRCSVCVCVCVCVCVGVRARACAHKRTYARKHAHARIRGIQHMKKETEFCASKGRVARHALDVECSERLQRLRGSQPIKLPHVVGVCGTTYTYTMAHTPGDTHNGIRVVCSKMSDACGSGIDAPDSSTQQPTFYSTIKAWL